MTALEQRSAAIAEKSNIKVTFLGNLKSILTVDVQIEDRDVRGMYPCLDKQPYHVH